MAKSDEIAQLIAKSDAELFAELWKQTPYETRQAEATARWERFRREFGDVDVACSMEPPTPEGEGKDLFESFVPKIKHLVCDEWKACEKLIQNPYSSETELAVVLCDVLSTAFVGIPITIISVLVAKIGVKRICDCSSHAVSPADVVRADPQGSLF